MSAAGGSASDDPFAHTRMTLGGHLDELRKRLFRGVLALLVAFVVSLVFRHALMGWILEPHRTVVGWLNESFRAEAEEIVAREPARRAEFFNADGSFRLALEERLITVSPTEGMWFVLKVAGWSALFFGAPFLLWQLWQFVAAGLYPRERRWVGWFFPPALLLFVGGVVFSYLVLVPYGMYYANRDLPIELIKPTISVGFYFSFLTTLSLGMGLVFQLPILMTFTGRVGMVEPRTYAGLRGHFVIVAVFLSALITPGGDLFSLVAMAGPMLVLYEIGILGARLAARAAARGEARA
ncbi:MAG TPA: twin-arginine translocase subunit TatC [Planctomycetota bacterium]